MASLPLSFQLDPCTAKGHSVLGKGLDDYNPQVMANLLKDALNPEPVVKGERKVCLNSSIVWSQLSVFRERALALFFTRRLPDLATIASEIDAGFKCLIVHNIFFSRSSLFEVLFFKVDEKNELC
ncbi:hypothetical protein GOP47_0021998 [Adiantum capillus-veneris]|uniref:Uncharacterized protein n=1 Tax=Adiantum capillus-veneris TaxID=13818 RepID=A0A9D4UAJ7_ADICA|nr:hypothetical protein GOP47_0021998 [Adiantum capillus-veneris]